MRAHARLGAAHLDREELYHCVDDPQGLPERREILGTPVKHY
jgi:hypothetical protein